MSLKTKEAVVAFDPVQVTIPQLIEAVDRLGFRASLKTSTLPAHPTR